ncbi:hypothetical protein LTR17_017943 [Elasticomyces elasticus]|nr:hypothetical protein LTR17_017943 [Elasticomyces elasticus]
MPAPHAVENHVFNHVAVSVPNVDEAAAWYEKIFGFRRIRSDRTTDRGEAPEAPIFKIYDQKLQKVKCAWLACGNGVGFEIFEFIDPPFKQPENFDYTRGGFFHIGVTVADPEDVAKRATEMGGKLIGEPVGMYEEKALYVQDPWGNIVELLSCSFEKLMGNRG